MMIAIQLLVYSIMMITVYSNCPDDDKKTTAPVVIITNTSVNATPGKHCFKSYKWLKPYTHALSKFCIIFMHIRELIYSTLLPP